LIKVGRLQGGVSRQELVKAAEAIDLWRRNRVVICDHMIHSREPFIWVPWGLQGGLVIPLRDDEPIVIDYLGVIPQVVLNLDEGEVLYIEHLIEIPTE
jgi:hypothetical protein